MKRFIVACILIQTFSAKTSFAQVGIVDQKATKKPTIVFIGTYHMGTQGNNVFKGSYDDVLSPKRQKELQVLLQKLKSFNPTKILVERDVTDSAKVLNRYKSYLKNEFKLTRNEVHQIGFKLAKRLNHEKIYAVDWGIFPEDKLYWYETYANKDPKLKEYLSKMREKQGMRFEKWNERFNKLTIIEQIRELNRKDKIESSHDAYFEIMRIGKGDEYVGANYLSWWYGRNMKILVNIIRITESADDRILVIYGSGHSKLLNQLTKESLYYNVIDPMKVLND